VHSQLRHAGSSPNHHVAQASSVTEAPTYFERAVLASDRGMTRHVSVHHRKGE